MIICSVKRANIKKVVVECAIPAHYRMINNIIKGRSRFHHAPLRHFQSRTTERSFKKLMANRPVRVAWDNSLARRNPTGGGVYATQLIRELNANPGVDLKIFEGWDAKRRPGEFGSQSILARA